MTHTPACERDPLPLIFAFCCIRTATLKTVFLAVLFSRNWIVKHWCPAVEFLFPFLKSAGSMHWVEGLDMWTQVPLQLCRQKQPDGSPDWVLREPPDLGAQILALLRTICTLPLNPWHDPPLASHNLLQTQVVSLVDFIRLLQIWAIRIIQLPAVTK